MRQASGVVARRWIARGILVAGVVLIAAVLHAQAPEPRKQRSDPLPLPGPPGGGTLPAVQVAQQQRSCVTGECHSQMGKAKNVHGPVGVGECTNCHIPVEATTG